MREGERPRSNLENRKKSFQKRSSTALLRSPSVRATDDRYIEVNEVFEVDTGWLREEVLRRTPQEIGLWVDPDQRAAFLRQLLEKGNVKGFRGQVSP